jgi:hypothetical protein
MKIRLSIILSCLALIAQEKTNANEGDAAVFGVFAGSTPCDDSIRALLQIPADVEAHLIQWKLTLRQEPKTFAPAGYELHCQYGITVSGQTGLEKSAKTVDRKGRWKMTKGANPDAVVCELDGGPSFLKVDSNVLHVLNRDRSLMVGGTGWSYTLYRTEASEARVDASLAAAQPPEGSYTLAPVATGPKVFGVFGGRSPCQGIARELKINGVAGRARVKWRVTLYQNPETGAPTTYEVRNSLLRETGREGNWTILRGTASDPQAIIYRLEATKTEAALFLLKGDDNVLFFLDKSLKPLVGNADLSYTLNRKRVS